MNSFEGLYDIRDYKEKDKNLILSTFLKGLYYGESIFSDVPKDIFMNKYKLVAQALVSSPNVVIKVACLKEDDNVILGYSILSPDFETVYWTFVKSAWRKKGIARSLLPKRPKYAAHLTELGQSLLYKFETEVKYNPFF